MENIIANKDRRTVIMPEKLLVSARSDTDITDIENNASISNLQASNEVINNKVSVICNYVDTLLLICLSISCIYFSML